METIMKHSEITEQIIKAYYKVYNTLGFGFLERVYEKALVIELRKQGLLAQQQLGITVFYDGENVGDYCADVLVNNLVILELKASESLCYEDECQLLNYLRATDIEVGLLLNFGVKPEFKRKIFDNDKKQSLNGGYTKNLSA